MNYQSIGGIAMKTQARQVLCKDCDKSLAAHLAHRTLREIESESETLALVYLCFECYHDEHSPDWRSLNE